MSTRSNSQGCVIVDVKMNAFCANCYEQASKFCICQNSAVVLCDPCLRKHEVNLPNEIHDSNPLAYYTVMQDLGIEGFRVRKGQISSGAVVVRKLEEEENLQYQQVRQEIEQTSALYLQWLDYLHATFTEMIKCFNQEKLVPMTSSQPQISPFSYFVYSLGEVGIQGAKLVESEPARKFKAEVEAMLQSIYSSCGATNNYQEYYMQALKASLQTTVPPAFSQFATYSPALQHSMSASPQQYGQQSAQIPPQQSIPVQASSPQRYVLRPQPYATYLPFSRGNMLGKWDTRSQHLSRVQLSQNLRITKFVVSVVLPSGDVCYIGGTEQSSRMAVVIDVDTGSIYDLGDLNQGRASSGLVYTDKSLYVFGGTGQAGVKLPTAEKYSFDQGTWRLIAAQMSDGRSQFNPAIHQQIVYIAGGYFSQKVETFHIVHETFRLIPLVLSKAFATIALVHNNELLILQETTVTRWRLNSDSAQQQSINLTLGESNTCPQTYGNRVFFNEEKDNSCDVLVLELESMNVIKVDGMKSGSGQE